MIDVVPVNGARRLRQFIELPYAMYARHPHWVPPLRRDERRRLSPAANPFLAHADMQLWLALSNGRVSGRIAAIDDRLYNETRRESVSWFGFFEAEDEPSALALLGVVEERAQARASRVVRGPVSPSLNETAGLLIEGFNDAPSILMPYNPPEYHTFLEAAGLAKVKDLLAWHIDLAVPPPERVIRLADRAAGRRGLRLRTLDPGAFDRDLAIVQRIYREAWEQNWGFVPPTEAETRRLARELRPVVDPAIVLFVELHGEPVACAVSIPDVNQVLRRMGGRLLPLGLLHFLRRRSIITRARMLLLGVVPRARRLGLYPLLMVESHRRVRGRGYRHGELSWTLEDNTAINAGIEAMGGTRYKTYRLYEKTLQATSHEP